MSVGREGAITSTREGWSLLNPTLTLTLTLVHPAPGQVWDSRSEARHSRGEARARGRGRTLVTSSPQHKKTKNKAIPSVSGCNCSALPVAPCERVDESKVGGDPKGKSNTQLKQEYFYSYILMNLLYEDMANQSNLDTYTKQIDNPKISFEDYIKSFNPNPKEQISYNVGISK